MDCVFTQINVEGTKKVVEAAKDMNVGRIIYPSGLGTNYYDKAPWAKNNYFQSKFLAEKEIMKGGVPYIIFRPSYILGPGDELIPEIIDQIWDSNIFIAGSGKIPMQPIFADDATRAFLAKSNQFFML